MCKHFRTATTDWIWIESLDQSYCMDYLECALDKQLIAIEDPEKEEITNKTAAETFLAFASNCPSFEQG